MIRRQKAQMPKLLEKNSLSRCSSHILVLSFPTKLLIGAQKLGHTIQRYLKNTRFFKEEIAFVPDHHQYWQCYLSILWRGTVKLPTVINPLSLLFPPKIVVSSKLKLY